MAVFLAAVGVCGSIDGDDLSGMLGAYGGAGIQELTDANFETTTQASTGATTGDWLIMFYAPWCGFCKDIQPEFQAFSNAYAEHKTLAAAVDCTQSDQCRRFGVRSYPTFLLFSRGKMYQLEGRGTADALKVFVTKARSGVIEGVAVPQPLTLKDEVMYWIDIIRADFELLRAEMPLAYYGGLSTVAVLFLLSIFVVVRGEPAAAAPTPAPAAAAAPASKKGASSKGPTKADKAATSAPAEEDRKTK
jgi:thiol-disulfide isomerase/thioredoxin